MKKSLNTSTATSLTSTNQLKLELWKNKTNFGFSNNANKIIETKRNTSKIWMSHFNVMDDLYDQECNEDGFISLGVAENTISYDILKDKLSIPNHSQKLTQYSEVGGIKECRELIARLLQDHIFKFKPLNNDLLVRPDQILVSSGVTSLVENIFQMFCNPGEICIIPSPFYPSFVSDASTRFGVKVIPAPTEVYDENDQIVDFKLDLTIFEYIYNTPGNIVKMVILNNPNNPNGWIFPEQEVKELIDWCRNKNIHFISDEVYSLSVFNQDYNDHKEKDTIIENQQVKTHQFKSLYDICEGNMGEYVHYLNGFSKDFCLNGYRVGYFYTQNPTVLDYMLITSVYFVCSNIAQSTLINILKDQFFISCYIKENQKRLKESYNYAIDTLNSFGIPFIKSSSGLFLLIDLRAAIKTIPINGNEDENTQELKLYEYLFQHKVLLNPGKICQNDKPGFFRLIFSHPKHLVFQGIKRISIVYKMLCK